MIIYNGKPKGIDKKRSGAPKKDPSERKAFIHISITQSVLDALDGMGDNRSALIEEAVKTHYLIK